MVVNLVITHSAHLEKTPGRGRLREIAGRNACLACVRSTVRRSS